MKAKLILVIGFLSLVVLPGLADVTIKSAKPAEDNRSNKQKYARPNSGIRENSYSTASGSGFTLSPEKQAQVQPISQQYLADMKLLKPQIKAKKRDIKELMKANTIDIAVLEQMNNELAELNKQEGLTRIRYQYELSRILTPEERKAVQNLRRGNHNSSRTSAFSQRAFSKRVNSEGASE